MKHNLKVTHLGEAGLKTVKFIGINGTESDLGIVKRAKRAFGVYAIPKGRHCLRCQA